MWFHGGRRGPTTAFCSCLQKCSSGPAEVSLHNQIQNILLIPEEIMWLQSVQDNKNSNRLYIRYITTLQNIRNSSNIFIIKIFAYPENYRHFTVKLHCSMWWRVQLLDGGVVQICIHRQEGFPESFTGAFGESQTFSELLTLNGRMRASASSSPPPKLSPHFESVPNSLLLLLSASQ